MVSVISDTSPLLYLHRIGRLEILEKLYGEIQATPAVCDELEAGRKLGIDVPDVPQLSWVRIKAPTNTLSSWFIVDLGPGESQVIALGLETPGSLLILDDQVARRIASLHQLRYTGTLGVVVRAKLAGYVDSALATIMAMRQSGLWISDSVMQEALRLCGE